MKTIKLLNRSAWAAAALFVATTVLTGLTACAEKDAPAVTPDKQITQNLVGTWLGSYPQKETIIKYGIKHYIVKAEQVMDFKDDGTGTCFKLGCNAAGEPITFTGGAKNGSKGHFNYTVGKDSVITIILRDNDGDTSTPKTWQLRFGTDGLNVTDEGIPYTLRKADADWQDYVANQEKKFLKNYSGIFTADTTDPSFLNDWQHCDRVQLSDIAKPQYTPWFGSSNNDIADMIRFDVQKEAGWEMAFCEVNNDQNMDARMFGLYNRYTGILRVFSYIFKPGSQGYGKEMGYKFMSDGLSELPRYPLYNSMEYSIPTCHNYNDTTTFDSNVILITDQTSYKPFETMISAYTRNTKPIGVSSGWHCTDFDFSGYTEKGIYWADTENEQGTLLSIQPYSSDEDQVLLTGKIVGDLEGEFSDPVVQQEVTGNWHSGISAAAELVGTLASGYTGIFGLMNSSYGLMNVLTNLGKNGFDTVLGKKGVQVTGTAACVASGLSTVMKIVDQFAGGGPTTTEKVVTNGKINMHLDAKVDLSGTISRWNSIDDGGVRITPSLLSQSKATKEGEDTLWMGSGCIGIAEDPVIYVSQEDLLSTSNSIAITKNGDNYTAPSFPNDSVRLVAFLDPRTVKVCLNTDVYHGIDSVHVLINYGVNTNRPLGNTECYRQMLKLGKRPTFSFLPKNGGNKLTTLTTPQLHIMTKSDVIKNDFYTGNELDSVKLDHPSGSVLPLYGRFATFVNKRLVMDPQVFVPFDPNTENTTVFGVTVPDYMVTVTVAFRCHEVPDGVYFSHAYIPKIELINHSDLATFYDGLKEYSDKSLNNQSVGTIFNDPNINVYNNSAALLLTKTLNILKKCK